MRDTRRTRVVLGVLLAAALVLITLDYRGGSSGPLRGMQHAGGTVFGGAERGVSVAVSPLVRLAGRGGSGGGSGDSQKVTQLQKQVLRLREQLDQQQLSTAQYRQLSSLLGLAGRGGYRIVAANVVAVAEGYAETVTLDAGSQDGVRAQDTVLNGQGLVGTVTSVSPATATVQLAMDATSVVGVSLAPSGQFGWVTGPGKTGSGSGMLQLQVLDQNARLAPGEPLVTYASMGDRPYVPGVPVGVITKVEDRAGSLTTRALVRPYVNFTALGVVGIVVTPPSRSPRFAVLPSPPPPPPPPPPTPGPSGSPLPPGTPPQPGSPAPAPAPVPSAGG